MSNKVPREWLKRPPGRLLFFASLKIIYTPAEQEMLTFAYKISKLGHAGQVRDNGRRFFDHPKTAAWIYNRELGGRDPRVVADLLMHDVPEECDVISPYRMQVNFGEDIALDVQSMTKLPGGIESTPEYLRRVIDQGPYSILSKLCDRLHNCRTLEDCTPEKRREQIDETKRYHLRMLVPELKTFGEPWATHARDIDKKIRAALAVYEK